MSSISDLLGGSCLRLSFDLIEQSQHLIRDILFYRNIINP